MNWKDILHFQKDTRTGILLLLILIILTLIFNTLLSRNKSSVTVLAQNDSIITKFEESMQTVKAEEQTILQVSPQIEEGSTIEVNIDTAGKTEDYPEQIKNSDYSYQNANYSNYQRVEKLKSGETISLNEIDTAQWKKIPGIGSSYSSRIVKYRELLGGYANKEQLMEVYGIDNELYSNISPYITTDTNYTKLKVNEMEFRELLRHPYLNYDQVKAIFNLRDIKGNISRIGELAMLDEFTPDDITRLEPYLRF